MGKGPYNQIYTQISGQHVPPAGMGFAKSVKLTA